MTNQEIYAQLCTSYRAIDDFRQKLLGFLPLASGGILAFLIDPKSLGAEMRQLLPGIGLLGFLVTLGLFFFELYGIRRCTYLIFVGEHIEGQSDLKRGQFTDRPPPVFGFIAEPMAAGVIYPAVMAAWAYTAMYFHDGGSASVAFPLAVGIFLTFAGLLVWYPRQLLKEKAIWLAKVAAEASLKTV